MNLAFVCKVGDDNDEPTSEHPTSIAMVKCSHCGNYAVGGYICDCGHDDVDPPDQLTRHGLGECVEVAS